MNFKKLLKPDVARQLPRLFKEWRASKTQESLTDYLMRELDTTPLLPEFEFLKAACPGRPFKKDPDLVVIHYTGSAVMASTISWMSRPASAVSAHFIIDRDGYTVQMVPLTHEAWHAGKSEWQGRPGVNQFSIGIELVNAGKLSKVPGTKRTYTTWYGSIIPSNQVVKSSNGYHYHNFPGAQIVALSYLLGRLSKELPSLKATVGHEYVSPGRKSDPGPVFPWHKVFG